MRSGEAKVDEPLAVKGAGHRLQNPDAPLAVLHQLVVGRKDARYTPLLRRRGDADIARRQCATARLSIVAPLAERQICWRTGFESNR